MRGLVKMDSMKLKRNLSIAIVIIGVLATFAVGPGTSATQYQAQGTVIDFGDWETTWTQVDLHNYSSATEVLDYACQYNNYTLVINEDGSINEINGVVSDPDGRNWALWVVNTGEMNWTKMSLPYDMNLRDYTVSSWAYCSSEEEPTIAVDQSGTSIYGYSQAKRTVSLSPSTTEIVSSVGAVKTLVGTDKYSNYPQEVVDMQNSGDIAIVGDYTSPSFEEITKTEPDIVLCDGSQYNHTQVANRLRAVSIPSVILYSGESFDQILNNIYIVGIVLGYDMAGAETIKKLTYAETELTEKLRDSPISRHVSSMISLSADMSPWVSGSYTYAGDVLVDMYGVNIFSFLDGWVHISSELIIKYNPSVIIILSSDYAATQEEYDAMMNSLSNEWKGTDAYKNGDIYLICEGAGEMAQRPGPRVAQLMELTARILNQDVFDDIEMSKFIGNNYKDFLTYTKYVE